MCVVLCTAFHFGFRMGRTNSYLKYEFVRGENGRISLNIALIA